MVFFVLSEDAPLRKDLENSSLTEIGKWLKCEMEVMHEGMSERKKRIKRIPVYLPKC